MRDTIGTVLFVAASLLLIVMSAGVRARNNEIADLKADLAACDKVANAGAEVVAALDAIGMANTPRETLRLAVGGAPVAPIRARELCREIATLASHRWVEVLNPDGIENSNNQFLFMDDCFASAGDRVSVVGAFSDTTLLVRLMGKIGGGTACPGGTLFAMSLDDFLKATPQYNRAVRARTALAVQVDSLLTAERVRIKFGAAR